MIGFLIIVALGIFLYFFFTRRNDKPNETTQDILGRNSTVYPNGIVESGSIYRMVIEMQLANLSTASNHEKKSIWSHFFSLLNTLGVPFTFLVQSQYLEIKDYTAWYAEKLREHELPEALLRSGEDVKKYIEHSMEESKIRDYRGYVILQYDPVAESVESGVETGVGAIDSMINKKVKMSREEQKTLAEQVLEEMAEQVYEFCDQANMQYQRLDRTGIYNVDYAQLQRELSTHSRMVDAIRADSFQSMKKSWEPQDA